jgi:NADPH-dependent 2,4-dienoyl-CoA reductase/sulfur reductase-like enzyme
MHIAIIGNGISGLTAARFIRKQSNHRITLISGETAYPFSRTALMYIYMGHLRAKDTALYEPSFYKKNRINCLQAWVESIDFEKNRLYFAREGELKVMEYDRLILATGSKPNRFGWPGEHLKGVHGMYSMQDLEAIERCSHNLQQAVIVGGGLIGIEMAEMFHSRHIPVRFLVRESSYWNMVLPPEESQMVNEEICEHGIDLQLDTELKEIIPDDNGHCRGVRTSKGEEIACGFVGLTAGVHPNVDFLRSSKIDIDKGIVVNEFLQTNIPGVYAIGDCAQLSNPPPGRRPIEAIWYVGKMMGEAVAYNICGDPKPYAPQLWFNSAKFFNIEYQVYGQVPVSYDGTLDSFFYRKDKKSLRIVFDKRTQIVVGFQNMGIRLRHEMCESWIEHQTPLEKVLAQLNAAFFDPEFSSSFHRAFVSHYNELHNGDIPLPKKGGLAAFWAGMSSLNKVTTNH